RMARDERLAPLARRINLLHHQDESRHLAFGRRYVRELFARHGPSWSRETKEGVRAYLTAYLHSTWREYYNPQAYVDAGLRGDPFGIMKDAWQHPAVAARREEIGQGAVKLLRELGLWREEGG